MDDKFCSLAIDQGTSLKNIIKEKKEDFIEEDYFLNLCLDQLLKNKIYHPLVNC
jgi:hypothetical protein